MGYLSREWQKPYDTLTFFEAPADSPEKPGFWAGFWGGPSGIVFGPFRPSWKLLELPGGSWALLEASWGLLKTPWGLQGPFKIQTKSNLSEGEPLIAHLSKCSLMARRGQPDRHLPTKLTDV